MRISGDGYHIIWMVAHMIVSHQLRNQWKSKIMTLSSIRIIEERLARLEETVFGDAE